jgi:hypothetical protein
MSSSPSDGIKAPRAPRRRQVEVDEARQERNKLRDENRRLRAELKVARRTISFAARAYPGDGFKKTLERMEEIRNA